MENKHLKAIVKLFSAFRYKHDLYSVFSDWCECAAIAFSQAADLTRYEKREARYLEIARKYDNLEMTTFSEILGEVTLAMEERPQDVLGSVFHALELHNAARGQFFTPYSICSMMARMTLGTEDQLRSLIERRGFICAQEPAAGSGAMVIALAEAIRDVGINYRECLHVTAIDIDRRAVHMSYIQLTLMHIPTVILEGDSLQMKFHEEWYTLAHVMGKWQGRFAKEYEDGKIDIPDAKASIVFPIDTNVSVQPDDSQPSYTARKGGQLQLF